MFWNLFKPKQKPLPSEVFQYCCKYAEVMNHTSSDCFESITSEAEVCLSKEDFSLFKKQIEEMKK